jgi:hypothetical protein
MDYEKGFKILKKLIELEDDQTRDEFYNFQSQFLINWGHENSYGLTDTIRGEKYRIIAQLDKITYRIINKNFSDLCNEMIINCEQLTEIISLFYRVDNLPSNNELQAICAQCVPNHLGGLQKYHENNMLNCLLVNLAKVGILSTDNVPLLKFVFYMSEHKALSKISNNLKRWVENVSQQLQLPPPVKALVQNTDSITQSSSTPVYLLIKIEPEFDKYTVGAWLLKKQNTIHTYQTEVESLNEMPPLVDEMLTDIYIKFHISKKQLTLEFFLPNHLLSKEIEHWTTESEFDEPIGCRFPVVVRSKERFEQPKLLSYLYDYWDNQVLQNAPETSVVWLETPELKGIRTKLEKGMIFFVLKFVPDERFLFKLIKLGVPLIFWPRKIVNNDEINEINNLLSCDTCQKLGQLPKVIREERLRIVDEEIDKQYITYHLSLLWDDYDRQLPTSQFGRNYSDLEGH